MDTTLISEIEYINILPELELDDSSFLKGSFVNGTNNAKNDSKIIDGSQTQQESEEQLKRIGELEKLVESQKKEIDELSQLKQQQ